MLKKLEESCDLQAFLAFLLSVILPLVVLFFLMVLFSCSPIYACPRLVEVFADPVDVSDQEGEFAEIRLDDYAFDSLMVQFEEKPVLRFLNPGTSRLVLVHDSASCPRSPSVACGLLGNVTLPNSRESYWRTWTVKRGENRACMDSVSLSSPKAGKSFQREKDSDRWVLSEPTFGEANPNYEVGVRDCGLGPLQASPMMGGEIPSWNLQFSMYGCESSRIHYDVQDLFGGFSMRDSAEITGTLDVVRIMGRALRVVATLLGDEASGNDVLDTLLVVSNNSPVVLSEVHHCPQEPEPEWVEVLNRSSRPLPLWKFQFCGRGGPWSKNKADSIGALQSILFTRDSLGMRETLGYKDVRIIQLSMGYLNNTSGNLSLCYGDLVLDSVSWDKSTVACPLGFNPLTGSAENTPGFQRSGTRKVEAPFTYKVSSRVVRRDGNPLRVLVESESVVELKLLDSAGHVLWQTAVPAQSNAWWSIPLQGLPRTGVAYIALSSGAYENKVGIVLRP